MAQGSRLGYFAALYKRMTMAVRDAIRGGVFADAARMEALDIAFATRYLETRRQYFAGELHGQSWLQAYESATTDRYTILQHLLIGINPHIMIDLGVAAARTCPGPALAGLDEGRASSWAFASKLAFMNLGQQSIAIGQRDCEAMIIGEALKHDPIAHLIKRKESDDVRENLRVLCQATAHSSVQTPQTSSAPP